MDPSTDFHTHLVPGVDDGSRGPVETVAMARGLAALGVRRIHLTPHQYRFGCDFTRAELDAHAVRVGVLLHRARVEAEVVAGAEYCFGERFLNALERGEELMTFPHGGEECLLVELPFGRPVAGVRRVGDVLRRRGVRPVLAHPERYVRIVPERLDAWRAGGWLFQLDLPSLAGLHGPDVRERAVRLVDDGQIDLTGSDLHRPAQLEAVRQGRALLHGTIRTETRA